MRQRGRFWFAYLGYAAGIFPDAAALHAAAARDSAESPQATLSLSGQTAELTLIPPLVRCSSDTVLCAKLSVPGLFTAFSSLLSPRRFARVLVRNARVGLQLSQPWPSQQHGVQSRFHLRGRAERRRVASLGLCRSVPLLVPCLALAAFPMAAAAVACKGPPNWPKNSGTVVQCVLYGTCAASECSSTAHRP